MSAVGTIVPTLVPTLVGSGVPGALLSLSSAAYSNPSPRKLWYGGSMTSHAANVVASRIVDSWIYTQLERSVLNHIVRGNELDNALWNKILVTVNADVGTAPDGDIDADEVVFGAAGSHRVEQSDTDLIDNTQYTASVFHKFSLTNGDWRFEILNKDATRPTQNNTATTIWQRANLTSNIGAGATAPLVSLRNDLGGTAGRVLYTHAQLEQGTYPTSPIETPESTEVTRAADQLSWPRIPTRMRSGSWQFRVIPWWADTDFATGESKYLWYQDASNNISFTEDGLGGLDLVLRSTGGNLSITGLTVSRLDVMTISVDLGTGALSLSGATAGDGSASGTVSAWGDVPTYAGWDSSGNHIDGLLSLPK